MPGTISRFDYIDAARTIGERFAELVRDVDSPDVRVESCRGWSLADCVGHIACEPSRYLDLVGGKDEWPCRPSDLNDVYAKQIANLPTRDTRTLADKFLADLDELLDTVRHFGARVPMMRIAGSQRVRSDTALGILIGEMTVRGRDIARVLGARWDIDPTIAPMVTRGGHQLLRPWADSHICHGHNATYDVRIRRTSERIVYRFDDGHLEIDPADSPHPDVYISVDPITVVLAAHGRFSAGSALLTGRAIAWGTKPWLAVGLNRRLAAARSLTAADIA
ncbi:maleylpyruvate isomerase N-terminal domain-containing protein [Gordonia sp. DT219]|uniref:maleylpyruvate isomerase N-terminal domain-containing protein n=1 Tax=Gordonia sp. DT219 TaxID=3416658 RepID=UPI003CED942E